MLRLLKILPWVIFALYLSLCSCRKDINSKAIQPLLGAWECHGIRHYVTGIPYHDTSESANQLMLIGTTGKKATGDIHVSIDYLNGSAPSTVTLEMIHDYGDSIEFRLDVGTPGKGYENSAELKYYRTTHEIRYIFLYSSGGASYSRTELTGKRPQ